MEKEYINKLLGQNTSRIQEVECPNCKTKLKKGTNYCHACGAKVSGNTGNTGKGVYDPLADTSGDAVVDDVVYEHGTEEVAREYLEYLYSKEAQKIIGENYYRPVDDQVAKTITREDEGNVIKEIPQDGRWLVDSIDLTDISHFGGWEKASDKFFDEGAIFDEIYE